MNNCEETQVIKAVLQALNQKSCLLMADFILTTIHVSGCNRQKRSRKGEDNGKAYISAFLWLDYLTCTKL